MQYVIVWSLSHVICDAHAANVSSKGHECLHIEMTFEVNVLMIYQIHTLDWSSTRTEILVSRMTAHELRIGSFPRRHSTSILHNMWRRWDLAAALGRFICLLLPSPCCHDSVLSVGLFSFYEMTRRER